MALLGNDHRHVTTTTLEDSNWNNSNDDTEIWSDKYIQWQFNCRRCLLDLSGGCYLKTNFIVIRVPDSLANALYFHYCSSRETERTSCQKICHDSNVLRRLPFFVGNLGADFVVQIG